VQVVAVGAKLICAKPFAMLAVIDQTARIQVWMTTTKPLAVSCMFHDQPSPGFIVELCLDSECKWRASHLVGCRSLCHSFLVIKREVTRLMPPF